MGIFNVDLTVSPICETEINILLWLRKDYLQLLSTAVYLKLRLRKKLVQLRRTFGDNWTAKK